MPDSDTALPVVRPRRGRPPRTDRVFDDTRDALVRCGIELLTEQGFTVTGIDAVLGRVNVPKGSFYHYFRSKQAFGLEVLQAYDSYFCRKLDRHLLQVERMPLDRLRDFMQDATAGMARYGFTRGCLVGNLGQEVSTLPEPYRLRLLAVMQGWEARVATCLCSAIEAGQLPAGFECERFAGFFWTGWEGAVLRARLSRESTPLDDFAACFMASLGR